jgi:purine-binding chemotaxis protein CheW
MLEKEDMQVVTFKLSNEIFGINISCVREIIKPLKTTSIPESKEWIEGVIELRNNVIPVINLKRYLNLHNNEVDNMRTIVVEIDKNLNGINVDTVEGIIRVAKSEIEKPSESVSRKYINGFIKDKDKLIILLDIDKLLDFEDSMEINNLIKDIRKGA